SLKYGNQVLVVMLFSYRRSTQSIPTITKLNECGLIPKVVICDQLSNNLKMRKLFNVTKENPLITYNNKIVWRDIKDFDNIDCNNKPRLAS
ncbi:Uncharacterized protein FWK35_00028697, partial [Aphis craccivora]